MKPKLFSFLAIIVLLHGYLFAQQDTFVVPPPPEQPVPPPPDPLPVPSKLNSDDIYPGLNDIYMMVEEMPQYPGGEKAMEEYLNSLEHPSPEDGEQRPFFVMCIINEQGEVTHPEIYLPRKLEVPYIYRKAVLDHLKAMPDFKPGMQNGKPVKVLLLSSVTFKEE